MCRDNRPEELARGFGIQAISAIACLADANDIHCIQAEAQESGLGLWVNAAFAQIANIGNIATKNLTAEVAITEVEAAGSLQAARKQSSEFNTAVTDYINRLRSVRGAAMKLHWRKQDILQIIAKYCGAGVNPLRSVKAEFREPSRPMAAMASNQESLGASPIIKALK